MWWKYTHKILDKLTWFGLFLCSVLFLLSWTIAFNRSDLMLFQFYYFLLTQFILSIFFFVSLGTVTSLIVSVTRFEFICWRWWWRVKLWWECDALTSFFPLQVFHFKLFPFCVVLFETLCLHHACLDLKLYMFCCFPLLSIIHPVSLIFVVVSCLTACNYLLII